jgi:hypothetical protein
VPLRWQFRIARVASAFRGRQMRSTGGQHDGASGQTSSPIRLGGAILETLRHVCAFFTSRDDRYDGLALASGLLSRGVRGRTLTYRIRRSRGGGAIDFALSGEMDDEHAASLRALLAAETETPILSSI